jgi:hypothetical protein
MKSVVLLFAFDGDDVCESVPPIPTESLALELALVERLGTWFIAPLDSIQLLSCDLVSAFPSKTVILWIA